MQTHSSAVMDAVNEEQGEGGLHPPLRPYQKQMIDFALGGNVAGLFLEMRLGKSAIAAKVAEGTPGRCVIIGPAFLRHTWAMEMRRWSPHRHYEFYSYNKQPQPSGPIGCLIFDESVALLTYRSIRTQNAARLAKTASRILFLSGSPWSTTPATISTQLAIAQRSIPSMNGYWNFARRYCRIERNQFGCTAKGLLPAKEQAFYNELTANRFLFLKRCDVIDQLPERIISSTTLEPDPKFDMDGFLEELERERGDENIHRRRRDEGLMNMQVLPELTSGLRCIVGCWYQETAIAVTHLMGGRGYMATGLETIPKRIATIEQWKQSEDGVLVVTIPSVQFGLDFSAAKDCFVLQGHYTHSVMSQFLDRMVKIGQCDPISVTYIYQAGGVEEKVASVCQQRKRQEDEITSLRKCFV